MKRLNKKSIAILAILVVTAMAAVGAYAYWTTTGTGTGSADAGDVVAVTVNQDSVVTGLYPGGPAQTLSGDFDNPNSSDVYIASVTATLTSVSDGTSDAGKPACTIADFELGGSAPVNDEIGVGDDTGSWSGLTIRLKNTDANQDNCKNATVNIAYTANAS